MKRFIFSFLLLCFFLAGFGQTGTQTQVDQVFQGSTWHTYVFKASNYATNTSKKYPLILFFPGLGETGGAATQLLVYGPSNMINAGTWNGTATVGSTTDTFLVISAQCPSLNCFVQQGVVSAILDTLVKNYRVDTNRIYLTGLSAGGFAADNYITANGNATELNYCKRPAAIVAMSAVVPNYPFTEFQRYAANGGKWWGITGNNDQRNYPDIVNNLETGKTGSSRVTYFTVGGGGHCCWNTFYDPGYTENFLLNGVTGNWNIYQWMAAQTRAPAGPSVSVGADITLALPTNSASLTSTVTDNTGTITTYAWTKVSGPNSPTFGTPSAQNTTISGLIAGTYVIRLTVTDNNSATAFDELVIQVNNNTAPVVNAGIDQNITLPTNQATLTGTYTDDNGTAVSTVWTQISGPNTATFTASTSLQTNVTGLIAGDYTFRLTVTDIGSLAGTDDIIIHVLSSPPPPTGTVNVNIYGGTNPYGNAQWNDWNVGTVAATNVSSGVLLKADGTSSGISAILSDVQGIGDNGATYGGTMAPAQVLRYASYHSGTSRTLTLSGLQTGYVYTIKLYASRANTGNTTTFSISGQPNQVITTDNNLTNAATFTAVPPVSGSIVITLTKSTNFTYINGFSIDIASAGNQSPVVSAGPDKIITLPTNSVSVTGTATDPDGTIASTTWSQVSGPNTAGISSPSSLTTNFTGLIQGSYVFKLSATDNLGAVGSAQMNVTVNAPSPTLVANAGADFSIADTIPYTILDASNTTGGTLPYTYQWKNIQRQNANPWCAKIMNPTKQQTVVNWTGLFGTYSYELTVTSADAQVSKDTVVVTVFYSNPSPRQKTSTAGWHYATSADIPNIANASVGDVIIEGATTDGYGADHLNKSIYLDFTNGGGPSLHDNQKVIFLGGKYLDITWKPNKDSVQCSLNGYYIVTNSNGQVETQSIEFGPIHHMYWTGEYNPANKTGDINYPGHKGGYAFSEGRYGFYINNGFRSPDKFVINMTFSDSVRHSQIAFIEYGNGGFSWVIGYPNATDLNDVIIHDVYGHDTHGEGVYWGRTEANRGILNNWEVYNCRFVRTGNEAFQFVNIGQNNYIHNNVMYQGAFNRRSTFDLDQDFNVQWGLATGGGNRFTGNIVYGSGEQLLSLIMHSHAANGVHTTGIQDVFSKNIFFNGAGADNTFIGDQDSGTYNLKFDSNYYGFVRFRGNEIFTSSRGTNSQDNIRMQQNVSPQETYLMTNNSYDPTKTTFINNTIGVTQSNNVLNNPPRAVFAQSGWADTMDVTRVSMYAPIIFFTDGSENPNIGEKQYQTYAYDSADYVSFQGTFWKSLKWNNTAPIMMVTDANWQRIQFSGLNLPADDLRLISTDFYAKQGIGLLDTSPVNPLAEPCGCVVGFMIK